MPFQLQTKSPDPDLLILAVSAFIIVVIKSQQVSPSQTTPLSHHHLRSFPTKSQPSRQHSLLGHWSLHGHWSHEMGNILQQDNDSLCQGRICNNFSNYVLRVDRCIHCSREHIFGSSLKTGTVKGLPKVWLLKVHTIKWHIFLKLDISVTMATQMNYHSCVLMYLSAPLPPNELPFPVCLCTSLLHCPPYNCFLNGRI